MALTETTPLSGTTVTTYTYDAANRLTGAGIFTCNAAGQLVRAQSGNATLGVYLHCGRPPCRAARQRRGHTLENMVKTPGKSSFHVGASTATP